MRITGRFFKSKTISIFILFISAVCLSCTRNQDASSVRFDMPDWQKTVKNKGKVGSSNLTIKRSPSRIMINISGPGIEKPIVEIWTANSVQTPPASFEFTVPKGSSRLIQVLAITRDFYLDSNGETVTEGMDTFFYGDATKDLSNPNETVEIVLNDMGLGENSLGEGVITGRYLDKDGNGPTGKVDIFFKPPNAPVMKVAQHEIHGGWFEFFRVDGVNFHYVLEDGRRLFEDFTIDRPGFNWDESKALFRFPHGWKDINGNPENGRKPVPPRHVIVGFFGPGSEGTGKKVCIPSSAAGQSELDLYTSETGETQVNWVGIKSTLSSAEAGVTHGGTPAAYCASGISFVDMLVPNESRLGSTHEAMGFKGAFQQMTDLHVQGETTFLLATYNEPETNKLGLKWRYLPGVTGPGRIAGVEVFSRVLPAGSSNSDRDDYKGGEGILCGELTNKNRFSNPFKFEKAVPYDGESLEQTLVINGIGPEDWEDGRVQFVLCPYNDKNEYHSNAAVAFRSYWGSSSGNEPKITADVLKIEGDESVINGLCYLINVKLLKDGSVPVLPPGSGASVNVNVTNGMIYPAYDTTCAGSGSNDLAIQFIGSAPAEDYVRVKPLGSGFNVWAEPQDPEKLIVPSQEGYYPDAVQLNVTATINNGSSVVAGQCVPIQFKTNFTLPETIHVDLTSINGNVLKYSLLFDSQSNCEGEVGGIEPPRAISIYEGSDSSALHYLKMMDSITDGNFEFTLAPYANTSSGSQVPFSPPTYNIPCSSGGCYPP